MSPRRPARMVHRGDQLAGDRPACGGVNVRGLEAAVEDDYPEAEEGAPAPSPRRPPRVVYEDEDVIAVDKPAGMSFHNDDLVHRSPGVLTAVRAMQSAGCLPGSNYDGPLFSVHRLDKVTSGILLFAKSEAAAAALSEQFRARRVHKYYVALSTRRPSKKMGTVSGDLAKSRRGAYKMTRGGGESGVGQGEANGGAGGNSAVTRFVSRGLTGSEPARRPLRMLVMKPLTGKDRDTVLVTRNVKKVREPLSFSNASTATLHNDPARVRSRESKPTSRQDAPAPRGV